MKPILALLAAVAAAGIAQAQPATPSQMALQIDNIINTWAQTIESQQRQIADLRKQIEDLKAKEAPSKK